MAQTFGETYAESLARDQILAELGGRSAETALSEGESPKKVWDAICTMAGVSDEVRWRYRDEPKRR